MPSPNTTAALPFDRPAYTVHREQGTHPVVLLCEHASPYIPPAYANLGIPEGAELNHIGWDIGALALAQRLSEELDAPLIAANYSRLLIDLNRPLHAPDSIPSRSDTWSIPGNRDIDEPERHARQRLFSDFHGAVARLLERRQRFGLPTRVVAVHSFNPTLNGVERPWELGVLYQDAHDYAQRLLLPLARQGIHVGDNQPYQIHPNEDVAVPVHGDARGLPCVLLELRNDLLGDERSIDVWTRRLSPLL
ncbi:N-formylglutamate amidohydrolase [Halomonas sp. McH1-25]|uniref:N-formylglutamate amidohydrolase n=1 Tax=unclassified Halomonas TaxID=2609666 RepID=UPI001EF66D97|nr:MULTISPECIES: N-formylglutamate amidohydrolase [unclassified Halomonas]MCG7601510.1 N-formylglutamate amidohydrolase [Halomonas sp. McH1-25]MCP1343939.1 N-formylglutamate amidohydrolase [Halomonas sp. FL8]MCP1361526.1 N-formylglutamate amidohydrolase [Halomonas sp. BBD45]MCP1363765.1 N-formylglutamate amidohydrolase [Halomonas sp. BBD48]